MNFSHQNQYTRKNSFGRNLHPPESKPQAPKADKKSNHILQLKDELVKMKNFINEELPELGQLIPHKNSGRCGSVSIPKGDEISKNDIERMVIINRKLFNEKQQLQAQLERERMEKKQLSRSLKKQGRMLTELYHSSNKNLLYRQDELRRLSRKISMEKQLPPMSHRSSSKKSHRYRQPASRQKVNAEQLKKLRSYSQKFQTQTSILPTQLPSHQPPNPKKDKTIKQTAPCYSSSEQQLITNLKEIKSLEDKMSDLMRDSQRTENRTKKLQLRNQMEKIANRLHCLKESLGKAV